MAGKAGGRHRDEIALSAAPAATPIKNKTKETKPKKQNQREET
jgi:hypothetical protein